MKPSRVKDESLELCRLGRGATAPVSREGSIRLNKKLLSKTGVDCERLWARVRCEALAEMIRDWAHAVLNA